MESIEPTTTRQVGVSTYKQVLGIGIGRCVIINWKCDHHNHNEFKFNIHLLLVGFTEQILQVSIREWHLRNWSLWYYVYKLLACNVSLLPVHLVQIGQHHWKLCTAKATKTQGLRCCHGSISDTIIWHCGFFRRLHPFIRLCNFASCNIISTILSHPFFFVPLAHLHYGWFISFSLHLLAESDELHHLDQTPGVFVAPSDKTTQIQVG